MSRGLGFGLEKGGVGIGGAPWGGVWDGRVVGIGGAPWVGFFFDVRIGRM